MGAPLVADVGRRAAEIAGDGSRTRFAHWFLRLAASLLANAASGWLEELSTRRRGRRRRRRQQGGADGESHRRHRGGTGRRGSVLSWLDFKLGLRMLIKSPGLTLAGGLGIAVAIGVCAGFFAFLYAWAYPSLPLDEGDRIVGLQNVDIERNTAERHSLHDFVLWRDAMRSVEELSAFRNVFRNLIIADATPEPVVIAEMTPSGFELARVPAFMGRTLVEADAEAGARDVLVIGYDVWRTRFAADPDIVGREVRIGRALHTVVGVMPKGFGFPLNHSYWTAFREDPADYAPGGGPAIYVSGRLAPGYTLEDARAELSVIGERLATEFHETHARFRTQVMPYTYLFTNISRQGGKDILWQFTAVTSFVSMLLLVVALNVAVLIYARTATRRGEITVRTALGASRGRIVGQLFAESLVLAAGAAAVGIGLARVGLRIGNELQTTEIIGGTPFWFDLAIPGPAMVYAGLMAILAAAVTGVVPALQATSKRVHQNLRDYHGGMGLRLGRIWMTLIVVQVAASVACLPIGAAFGWGEIARLTTTPTYPVDRFLVVWATDDEESPSQDEAEEHRRSRASHLATVRNELVRRLETEPGVAAGIPVIDLPNRGSGVRVVVERAPGEIARADALGASSIRAHPDFFGSLEIETLAGRTFFPGDLDQNAANVVVVDRRFVTQMLDGGNALGRRIRFVSDDIEAPSAEATEQWFEIVGVVENLHESRGDDARVAPRVYLPLRAGLDNGVGVMLKIAGITPASLSARVREIAGELDPTLRVSTYPLEQVYRREQLTVKLATLMVVIPGASVLLLSAAGIYALMSFTVSQRRREIAIRAALGAQRGRLLGGIFRRAAGQLGLGVAAGLAAAVVWDWSVEGKALQGHGVLLLTSMVVVMIGVGLLAALGPARRGLGMPPAEALRAE